jgi:hypothetical protein
MCQSTVAPRRPVFEEPAPLNRRIYFGAVCGVRRVAGWVAAIVGACAELLAGLLELMMPWAAWLVFALIIYLLDHCSANEPTNEAAQVVQASQPAQTSPAETHNKRRRRTHHPQPMPVSSTPTAASSAR